MCLRTERASWPQCSLLAPRSRWASSVGNITKVWARGRCSEKPRVSLPPDVHSPSSMIAFHMHSVFHPSPTLASAAPRDQCVAGSPVARSTGISSPSVGVRRLSKAGSVTASEFVLPGLAPLSSDDSPLPAIIWLWRRHRVCADQALVQMTKR